MNKAIIRIQKLKSPIAIRRSMLHSFREQDTPNADPKKLSQNESRGANSTSEGLVKLNKILPEKVRKNAVLAVEYLITASPEALKKMNSAEQNAYFKKSMEWLEKKHGKENIVCSGIHRDETTPHMYAYVVPIDPKGRLNCRHFFGEKTALSQMQTDFAENVAKHHGLERGLEGSKAKHTSIQTYYSRVNAPHIEKMTLTPLEKPSFFESKEDYGKRAAKSVIDDVAPRLAELTAKSRELALIKENQEKTEKELNKFRNVAKKLASENNDLTKIMQHFAGQGVDLKKLFEVEKENMKKEKTNGMER